MIQDKIRFEKEKKEAMMSSPFLKKHFKANELANIDQIEEETNSFNSSSLTENDMNRSQRSVPSISVKMLKDDNSSSSFDINAP